MRDHEIEPIPKEIADALSATQAHVDVVKKTQTNTFGNYKFSSVDDINVMLVRPMAAAGLSIIPLEVECEIKSSEAKDKKTGELKTVQWLKVVYQFVFAAHGATWTDELNKRTLVIQITGPQSFAAAESFIQKQYLRNLFKIPTGDMELDAVRQAETLEDQVSPPAKKSSAKAKRDGDDTVFNEIRDAIRAAINPDMLKHVRTETYRDQWDEMPEKWAGLLNDEYEDKAHELKAVH